MKAIVLDGSQTDDITGERVRVSVIAQLQAQGWDVEHIDLGEKTIGNCAGDFFCWIRTPGICNVNDDNRVIAESLVVSDLVIYLTPVTFGGYSSTLKRIVDHQIQNVSPFFTKIEGETHHHKRYKSNPDLLAVGWMAAPDAQSEAVFGHLVQRNAINFHARANVAGVVFTNQADAQLRVSAQQWLEDLRRGGSTQRKELLRSSVPFSAIGADSGCETAPIKRALLLVGSPKTRKSTSNSLGGYLFEQLNAQSIQTETIYLHTVLRSSAKMQALFETLDATDLVTLSFPLYVDSLPAPVIEALERLAVHRQVSGLPRRQLFSAIANCGFPEAHHCDTALAICQTFARQVGFEWADALALGGGQAINGVPLVQAGGKTLRIRKALELAADALVQGQAIPQAARDLMAAPVIPHWAYRLLAGAGWIQTARGYSALKSLRRQPYLVNAK